MSEQTAASATAHARPRQHWLFIATFAGVAIAGLCMSAFIGRILQPGKTTIDWTHAGQLSQPVPLPDFSLQDQDRQTFTRQEMHGRVWIADFIFLQCQSTCPILSSEIPDLQQRLNDANVQFVSFSITPTDGPGALKDYQLGYRRADPDRWRLLAADAHDLPQMLVDLDLADSVEKARNGLALISPCYFLIDANGQIRGAYDGTHKDQLDLLVKHASILAAGLRTKGRS